MGWASFFFPFSYMEKNKVGSPPNTVGRRQTEEMPIKGLSISIAYGLYFPCMSVDWWKCHPENHYSMWQNERTTDCPQEPLCSWLGGKRLTLCGFLTCCQWKSEPHTHLICRFAAVSKRAKYYPMYLSPWEPLFNFLKYRGLFASLVLVAWCWCLAPRFCSSPECWWEGLARGSLFLELQSALLNWEYSTKPFIWPNLRVFPSVKWEHNQQFSLLCVWVFFFFLYAFNKKKSLC